MRELDLDARVYQAFSSELFGKAVEPHKESTPFYPRGPYAAAKAHAFYITAATVRRTTCLPPTAFSSTTSHPHHNQWRWTETRNSNLKTPHSGGREFKIENQELRILPSYRFPPTPISSSSVLGSSTTLRSLASIC